MRTKPLSTNGNSAKPNAAMSTAPASTTGLRPNRSDAADQPRMPTTANADEIVRALRIDCLVLPAWTPYASTKVVSVDCATNAESPTPTPSSNVRGWLRRTSTSGAEVRLRWPSNTGVSSTFMRTNRPMPSSTRLSRNGTRQPQSRNAFSPTSAAVPVSAAVDSTMPHGAPALVKLAHSPRREVACSADISTAPPHSPPTEMPCTTRSRISPAGASQPTCP